MKERLLIIGAGGHGKVAADIAAKMKRWEKIEFLDDDEKKQYCMGYAVSGRTADAGLYREDSDFFIAVGDNDVRERLQENMEGDGCSVAVLVHPEAVIGLEVEIGKGSIVMAGAVINSSSRIGKGCIINTGASIDHDNEIGDYVHIAPGAHLAGTVRVGKGSFIGAGSIVINNVELCSGCQTGAGAVVVKDIKVPGIYVGVPVRLLGEIR